MDNCFVTEDDGRHAPAGKKQPAQAKGYQVHMPPSKNIPLTVSDLTDAVRQSIRHEERATFVQICQLIEGCAMTEFAGLRRRVKKNYRFFSEAAMHRDMPTRKGRGLKKEDTLNEMEITLLNDFWELMGIAHYKCLSEADWLAVQQERLMLDMPIKMNWDALDNRMLTTFFQRYPDRRESLYEFTERVLLFHRGVGVTRKKDLFIVQKVDLLVKYLIAWPAIQVFYKLAPHLGKRAQEAAARSKARAARKNRNPNELLTAEEREEQQHVHAQTITRISLRTIMPTWRDVFANIHKPLEVVEPTYKDILLLYRKAVTPPTDKELEKNPKLAEQYRRDARGIIVKRFDEVPVADVEIVFPDKDVGLKLIDVLTLWGTALGALVAGVMMFVRGSVSLNVLMSALTTVGGKLFQTYATMQRKKADLSKQMAQTVFDVSLDANEGAIYGVLDEMADQYIKEQMLAYFMLVKHKYPATEEELDEMCESFLSERYDMKVDFAIEESLPKLMADGLIEGSGDPSDPRLHAVPLDVAQERLMRKWQRAFSYGDDDSDSASFSGAMGRSMASASAAAGSFRQVGSALKGIIPGASRPPKSDVAAADDNPHRKRDKVKRMLGLGKHKEGAVKEA